MRRSDLRCEDNYNEYIRLLKNNDYIEVSYDEESGGVSAIHKLHKFDKQQGPFGSRRGDYEVIVINVFRKHGDRVLLESETSSGGKKCDGLLNDFPMEIKAVEGTSSWAVSSKLREAAKQHAVCVVLFFPEKKLYSQFRVSEGVRLYETSPDGARYSGLLKLFVVVEDCIVEEREMP